VLKQTVTKAIILLDVVFSLLVINEDVNNLKLIWLLIFFKHLYKIQSKQAKFPPNKL